MISSEKLDRNYITKQEFIIFLKKHSNTILGNAWRLRRVSNTSTGSMALSYFECVTSSTDLILTESNCELLIA